MSYRPRLSAPRCCGPPDELSPDSLSGGPQYQGTDSFDCRPERYKKSCIPKTDGKGSNSTV